MKQFKDPSFQDRQKSAADAKNKALEKLRTKAPLDPQVAADRREAAAKREARLEETRSAKIAAAKAESEAKAAAAEAANKAPPPPTEEERKAARDARYAARKGRK